MDGLLTNTPLKISEASFKDPTTLKNDLVDQIMNGIMAASDAGAKDYAVKNPGGPNGSKVFSTDDAKNNITRLNQVKNAIDGNLPVNNILQFKDRRNNRQIEFKDYMVERYPDGKLKSLTFYTNTNKTNPYYIIKEGKSTALAEKVLGISM
jgi:hypothetical protein